MWKKVTGAAKLATCLISGLICAGCAQRPEQKPVFPVSGQVLFDGRPVPNAAVTLVRVSPSEKDVERPTAMADREGKFELTTYKNRDGAPTGDYVVLVEARRQMVRNGDSDFGENYLPPKYSNASSSDLKVTITEGPNALAVKLKR